MVGILTAILVMNSKQLIHLNLVRLMRRDKIRNIDLANFLETTPANVSRWVNGQTSPELWMFDKMKKVLGWHQSEFFKPIEGHPKSPEDTEITRLEVMKAAGIVNETLGFERPKIAKKKPRKA